MHCHQQKKHHPYYYYMQMRADSVTKNSVNIINVNGPNIN